MLDSAASSLPYASFWKRFYAYGYDSLLITIATVLINWRLGDLWAEPQPPLDSEAWLQAGLNGSTTPLALMGEALSRTMNWQDVVVPLVISALYNIYFLTGRWQATPGKRFCGIYVVNTDGGALTLVQSLFRHIASGFSMVLCGLPYAMIFFNREKMAPHDLFCDTRVILGKTTH